MIPFHVPRTISLDWEQCVYCAGEVPRPQERERASHYWAPLKQRLSRSVYTAEHLRPTSATRLCRVRAAARDSLSNGLRA